MGGETEKNNYPKASCKIKIQVFKTYFDTFLFLAYLVNGALLTYIAGMFLIIAFCRYVKLAISKLINSHLNIFSPYWVKSFEETHSEFKNMGLWEYCFEQFRYPYYQFPHLFDGCHHVFSQEFYVIREWLLPPWLMAVQAFVTMSFLLSFSTQVVMALQLCRWPLEFILRYEYILSAIDFLSVATTSKYFCFDFKSYFQFLY